MSQSENRLQSVAAAASIRRWLRVGRPRASGPRAMIAHPMFDHVTLRVADPDAAARFYTTVLDTLGVPRLDNDDGPRVGQRPLAGPRGRGASGHAQPPHRLLRPLARRRRGFWRAGVEAGYQDDGEPGPRPAVHARVLRRVPARSGRQQRRGRVRRRAAPARPARPPVDPRRGRRRRARLLRCDRALRGIPPDPTTRPSSPTSSSPTARSRSSPARPPRTCTSRSGPTTTRRSRPSTRTATALGYADHGAPGERPEYHPGYFAAFVLDPDGNNVELVNHHR